MVGGGTDIDDVIVCGADVTIGVFCKNKRGFKNICVWKDE